jgi:hypothetical protein
LTLTILLTLDPAASTMALMLLQQAWVSSPMLPETRFPDASAGIWPETKIWPLARMAWDYSIEGLVSRLSISWCS